MNRLINKITPLKSSTLILITLIALPSFNVFINLFKKASENWGHIKEYLLKDYIMNSLSIIIAVGFFTLIIGVSLAWLISFFDFPFKKFFKWSLILPLTIPAYIGAYTYSGLLSYTGVIQSFLRNSFNISVNQKYFDIMSLKGSIFIFTIFLFPYVYTLTRAFFQNQSASIIESSKLLGARPFKIFFKIALPLSRVACAGGVTLVILEVLNDYGVVKYFGVPTFSTAIFKTWFSLGDTNSAIRLSSILMLIVFIVLLFEKLLRGRIKYSPTTSKRRKLVPTKLTGAKGIMAFSYCSFIFLISFLIPTTQLLYWVSFTYESVLTEKFINLSVNTLLISLSSSILILFISLVIASYCRLHKGIFSKISSKITILGYSIPASVISIGVLITFIGIDKKLFSGKLILTTSIYMLVFAYVIRFLAVGFNNIESGYEKIGIKYLEASRILGKGTFWSFIKVELPLMMPALVSGFILLFVDILKELPLTLILRPFNFETLATKAYEYANDEMIYEASVSSIIIVLIGIIAVCVLQKFERKEME